MTKSQRRFAPTSRIADLRRNECRFASESVPISAEYTFHQPIWVGMEYKP
jgi:hypothetical protein